MTLGLRCLRGKHNVFKPIKRNCVRVCVRACVCVFRGGGLLHVFVGVNITWMISAYLDKTL